MKLESVGILIGLRPLGERDSLARIFSQDYGVMVGVMRAAQVAKKNKPLVGQCGNVAWNARLDSQLGTFHWEPEKNLSAGIMSATKSLMFMNSAFSLINALLPEREKYENLYNQTNLLLKNLSADNPDVAYLNWEICFLKELGYALDLSSCSGCGTVDDLKYLSPKTGRAVCETCAKPYINKLYTLPLDIKTTGIFLQKICENQGVTLPMARRMVEKNNF